MSDCDPKQDQVLAIIDTDDGVPFVILLDKDIFDKMVIEDD